MITKNISEGEYLDKLQRIYEQQKRIKLRPPLTLVCSCGTVFWMSNMYKCLYCKEYFCAKCAEAHFGKTVEQWRKENPSPINGNS